MASDPGNRVHERSVVTVSVLAGAVGAAASPEATASGAVNGILIGVAIAFTAWAGASAPWWVCTVAAAVAASIAGGIVPVTAGILGVMLGLGIGIGVQKLDLPELRALVVGIAFNVFCYSALGSFQGLSTSIAVVVAVALIVVGVRRRPTRIRRWAYATLGAVGLLAVLSIAGYVIAAASARSELTNGKQEAKEAISALNQGDFDTAAIRFRASERAMRLAESRLDKPWALPAAAIPIVSQHREAIGDLTAGGTETAATVAEALEQIDPDTVRVTDGRVDLSAVAALEAPFAQVEEALSSLDRAVENARSPWLLWPITEVLDELDTEIADNAPRLDNAISAVQLAPQLLGGDSTRNYLVLFLTPAEARGLGGFPGNYAELTVENGRIEMSEFGRIRDLERTALDNKARFTGPAEFLDRYGRFGRREDGSVGVASWRNITISPHFPDVAQAAADLYPRSGGRPVDGVIAMDPYVLETLLAYTGPIQLTSVDRTLTEGNAASYILTEQYFEPEQTARIDALDEAAELTLDRLLTGRLPEPTTLARDLGPLAADRRLLIWTNSEEEQELFDRTGLLGEIPILDGADGYSVAVTNSSGNKIETFLQRDIEYSSTTDPETARTNATLDVELTNTAPASGLPDYVIGNVIGLPRGTSRLFVEFFSPLSLDAVTIDGEPSSLQPGSYKSWNVYSGFLTIGPGQSVTAELVLGGELENAEEFVTWTQPLVIDAAIRDPDTIDD
ncbi:MAG: DUF4012 domain-containing protein [Actinomycetota bacterium]|nr:DUF4012 domain-containing protein [Actinomycetota bacterium]